MSKPIKASDILYEEGNFWVTETAPDEFSIFMVGLTHSIGIGEAYPTLDLASARVDYIAKHWDVQKHRNRLVRERRVERSGTAQIED